MHNTLLVLLLLLMKYVKSLELSDFTVSDGMGEKWTFSPNDKVTSYLPLPSLCSYPCDPYGMSLLFPTKHIATHD